MAENILLPSYTGITALSDLGVYALVIPTTEEMFLTWQDGINDNIFVELDGVMYECTPQRLVAMENAMAVGNCAAFGGTGNGEPFIISITTGTDTDGQGNVSTIYAWIIGALNDTAPTQHTVEVYQVEASSTLAVVLKDRSGADVTYEVPNGEIKLNTPSGTQIFTAGQAVDNVPITLDLADGDQTVTAGDGQLIKSAVIQKPATLSPANIVKDVNIAGVVGTFEGGGGGDDIVAGIIDGTFSGSITNAKCTLIRNNIFSGNANLTAVDFPACTSINLYAFYNCTNLSKANFPACTSIATCAFQSCLALETISFPACTYVAQSAFDGCSQVTEAIFPLCTSLGNGAFYRCYKMSVAYFPLCTSLGKGAFSHCSTLNTAYFPNLSIVPSYAFTYISGMKSVYFPAVTSIGASGFFHVHGWTELNSSVFPICTYIGTSAFAMNEDLLSVYFPMVAYMGNSVFYECHDLQTAIFPVCSTIGNSAFYRCYSLTSVYLFSTSVVPIGAETFSYSPIALSSYLNGVYGSVYVRESLADSYKTTSNWSKFANRIVGLTDEEIAAILEG